MSLTIKREDQLKKVVVALVALVGQEVSLAAKLAAAVKVAARKIRGRRLSPPSTQSREG